MNKLTGKWNKKISRRNNQWKTEDRDDLDVSLRKEHENTPTPPTTRGESAS